MKGQYAGLKIYLLFNPFILFCLAAVSSDDKLSLSVAEQIFYGTIPL